MDKKTEKHILNILRHGTITWYERNECLNRGRREKVIGSKKDGTEKTIYERVCDICGEWRELRENALEVDHIDPVGSFNGNFDDYVRRMYCDPRNLQAVCVKCHDRKSAKENAIRRKIKREEREEDIDLL